MWRDLSYVSDMLREAELTLELIDGIDRETFVSDDSITRHAVDWTVARIGDFARKTSAEFRMAHPEIPWRNIILMRDCLRHDLDCDDLHTLWNVATRSVPALIAQLEPLIPPEE